MTEILAPAIPMRPRATRVRKPDRRAGSVPSDRSIIASWFASYGATAAQVASLLPPVTTAEQAAHLTELAQP